MVELVEFNEFSEIQQKVIELRLTEPPASYDSIISQVQDLYHKKIYPSTIVTILKRSALGFRWNPSTEKGGAFPYLCPADKQELQRLASLLCSSGEGCIDPQEFLDIARGLKLTRLLKATELLEKCSCQKLLYTLQAEATEPTRSWVNSILEELQLKFTTPIYVETVRADACSLQVLIEFYQNNEEIIKQCPIELLFGVDETMINSKFKGKVLIQEENDDKILRKLFKIPHITAVCCHTANGSKVPPMFILPDIQHLPAELYDFDQSGRAWFCSSPSGWMCRDLFLLWTIHFVNWLSVYRRTLSAAIRNKRALLICDGHSSRECPIALLLLRNAGVDVLVLPGHTTHVTQMFDVVLAAPLKIEYAKLLSKLLRINGINRGDKSQIAQKRKLAIYCFLTAWDRVCTMHHCAKAASVCGYHPFKADAIAQSVYVREFDQQEEEQYLERVRNRTRFDINGKVITHPDVLQQILEMVSKSIQLRHLCFPIDTSYSIFCKRVCTRKLPNSCYFLGRLPPFVNADGQVINFPEPND